MSDNFEMHDDTLVMHHQRGSIKQKIPAGIWAVVCPPTKPPFLLRTTIGEDLIDRESKSWDFDGSEIHKTVHRDFESWLNGTKHFRELGIRNRRGIMMYGPPGTGKTVIAQSVVKKALDYGVPVIHCPEDFNSLQALTHFVQTNAGPVVITSDEADKVEDIITPLAERYDYVFVIATTNEKDSMHDRVTKRPGRFDRVLLVDRMSPGMVRKLCGKFKIESAADFVGSHFPTVTPAALAEISFRMNLNGENAEAAVRGVKRDFYE